MADPQSVESWLAEDGSLHQRKCDAALHDLKNRVKQIYLQHRPGQTGAAEQFALAAIEAADALIPLLQQVAPAKAMG